MMVTDNDASDKIVSIGEDFGDTSKFPLASRAVGVEFEDDRPDGEIWLGIVPAVAWAEATNHS